MRRSWAFAQSILLLLICLLPTWTKAADLEFLSYRFEPASSGFNLFLSLVADPQGYYILDQGTNLSQFAPVAISLGGPGIVWKISVDPSEARARFWRVRRLARVEAVDSDQDGIDDVYELTHPSSLDPLNPLDAWLDPDRDGRSSLAESLLGTDSGRPDGLTVIRGTSPAEGDIDVAVTSQVSFLLSQPLSEETSINEATVYAENSNRLIGSTARLSADRRQIQLRFNEALLPNSLIRIHLIGDSLRDQRGVPVDADGDGAPGGIYVFSFRSAGLSPAPGTGISGRVFAAEADASGAKRPLPGVRISVVGAEQALFTVTDASGGFTLNRCPSGGVTVSIDGRTSSEGAFPSGPYYPLVQARWEAVLGVTNTPAGGTGEIYLPRLDPASFQSLTGESNVALTAVWPPSNPGTASIGLADLPSPPVIQVTIPTNAVTADALAAGAKIGIRVLPATRLPTPAPPGLEMSLVLAVLTDGPKEFLQPVSVRLPNLPHPRTGRVLAPGAKTALWTLNPGTGNWSVDGVMTVSSDGSVLESDPGTGIRQASFHGAMPGAVVIGRGVGCTGPNCSDLADAATLRDQAFDEAIAALLFAADLVATNDIVSIDFAACLSACDNYLRAAARNERLQPPVGLAQVQTAGIRVSPVYNGVMKAIRDISRQKLKQGLLPGAELIRFQSARLELIQSIGNSKYLLDRRRQQGLRNTLTIRDIPAFPNARQYYLSVTADGQTRRSKTTAQGALRLILGASEQNAQITVFDPVSGMIGSTGLPGIGPDGTTQVAMDFVLDQPSEPIADNDLDRDGLTDTSEFVLGTNPNDAANIDIDGDGISNGYELAHGLNPYDPADASMLSGFTDDVGLPLIWSDLFRYRFGQNVTVYNSVSREVSVFNFGQPAYAFEGLSREVSVYNFGQPTYGSETITLEVSVFNGPLDTDLDGVADAYEVNHGLDPSNPLDGHLLSGFSDDAGHPLTWEQLYHYNFGRDSKLYDIVSREVSVFNFGQGAYSSEALSKEVSVFNGPLDSDGDGVADTYEINHGLDPSNPGDGGGVSGFKDDQGHSLTWMELYHWNFGRDTKLYEAITREVSVFNFGQAPNAYEAISQEVSVFNIP